MLQQALTSATGVLDLDEHQYDQLLAAPRDFSVTVLYTATSPQYKCTACHMFKDSYNQVARGWQKRKDKRHVFAMVDAHRALNVLRRVRRATNPAPIHAGACDLQLPGCTQEIGSGAD